MTKQLAYWHGWVTAWLLMATGVGVRAQWTTQTNSLKAGWNAVYLFVDAGYAPISDVMASAPDIEEVWLWNPPIVGQQFVESPQVPTSTGSRWSKWTSSLGPTSPLKVLIPNAAYYVKVRSTTATYSWRLKGRPVPPVYGWTSSGLNFIGFPLARQLSYERFFLPAPQLMQGTEIYASPGGAFGASNPDRVYDFARTVLQRGEAVWMRVDGGFNRYFGPFEVNVAGQRGINFGTELTQVGFRIRNTSPGTNKILMTWHRSELPPTGQPVIPALPPLVVRGDFNIAGGLSYAGIPMVDSDEMLALDPEAATAREWDLPPAGQPGADIQVVVGVARARITEEPGTVLAGILKIRDEQGLLQVDLPVTVTAQSPAGLWVGEARVTQVTQYLKNYAGSGTGSPQIGRRWTSTSVDTFTGGDAGEGLDLDGTFAYAVNVGEAVSSNVRGVAFTAAAATTGYVQSLQATSATWLQPDYGTTAADNALEVVMRSMGYSGNPNKPTFTMNVEAGVRYKLQLLFGESGTTAPWRGFDVLIDDKVVVPNFIPGTYTTREGSFAVQKAKVGVVVTHEFTSASAQVKVTLDGPGASSTDIQNRDPILNGLTLERLDAASLPPELVAEEGAYVLNSTEERLVGVPKPFPLRLIVHDDGTNAVLLQRVFVGENVASNTIVSTRQVLLDPLKLKDARRISAAHLPWTQANAPWSFLTGGTNGNSLVTTVSTPYDATGSNPFVHQYHPDHDNLNAGFSQVLPKGQESFGITRTIRLTPAAVAFDFESQTAGFKKRIGTYEETVTLEGSGANVRTFRSAGTYSLTRISPISKLTKD